MNALSTKFGVNAAAAAVVATAAVLPMQSAAIATPVSDYASQWSQTVHSVASDLATAPAFLSDPAVQPVCVSRNFSCVTPQSTVIWAVDFAAILSQNPLVPQRTINFFRQFQLAVCTFNSCRLFGSYNTES